MRRTLPAVLTCLAALFAAAPASAVVQELGVSTERPPSSCPENCQAVGRVTGYQVTQKGSPRSPFQVKEAGRVVAFSIRLGEPNKSQIAYFEQNFGGAPKVRVSILRRGKKAVHRLLAQSENFGLRRYFGSTPTFALAKPLRVPKGAIVALTVPTWAPAFSVGLEDSEIWRSSRTRGKCDNVTGSFAHQRLDTLRTYACIYPSARLRYSATFIPDNQPTTSG